MKKALIAVNKKQEAYWKARSKFAWKKASGITRSTVGTKKTAPKTKSAPKYMVGKATYFKTRAMVGEKKTKKTKTTKKTKKITEQDQKGPSIKLASPTPKVVVNRGCSSYKKFPDFKQFDKEWKDDKISQGKKIEDSGSLLTVFSMILNANGKQVSEKTVTPKSLNAWLLNNGGYNKNGRLTKGWTSKFGLTRVDIERPHKNSQLRQQVCAGKSVILKVKEGFALAVGIDDDGKTFIVNEPSYTSRQKIDEKDVLGAIVYN